MPDTPLNPQPMALPDRLRRWVLPGLLLAGLAGCNVLQTVYNQAPRYVQWRTNVAHHFTDEQY